MLPFFPPSLDTSQSRCSQATANLHGESVRPGCEDEKALIGPYNIFLTINLKALTRNGEGRCLRLTHLAFLREEGNEHRASNTNHKYVCREIFTTRQQITFHHFIGPLLFLLHMHMCLSFFPYNFIIQVQQFTRCVTHCHQLHCKK